MDDLRDARIFITGGTGFFGCSLLESFARMRSNATITVLTRSPESFAQKAPNLAAHPAVSLVTDFPASTHFTHVIHAALNLDTGAVLDFAAASGARRFLYTSSGAVYGAQPASMTHIPETYEGVPNTAYGEEKRASELLCASERRMECTIARGFAFVGPYLPLDSNFAIGNFIRDALRGGPIRVQGDGRPYRSYLFGDDLATWLWTILVRGQRGRAYNVGSDRAVTIAELARIVATTLRCSKVEMTGAPTVPSRYVPDITRAREELGLEVTVDLEESIRRTAAR